MNKLGFITALAFIPTLAFANSAGFTLGHNYNSTSKIERKLKEIGKDIGFSYSLKYTGPSLSPDYQNGATYKRSSSGQAWHGGDNDPTASTQLYHSTALSYKATKNLKLSYSYTFQEDLNKGIKYESYFADGSKAGEYERSNGLSYNNQRINALVTNIYSNNYFFLMSSFFYERPTTDGSQADEMTHGLGIQPLIGIYSSTSGLYHGLKLSIQRYYYKRQDYNYNCGGYTCNTKHQTFIAGAGFYIGYNISDKLTIDGELKYDWDMDGDQVNQFDDIEITNLGAIFDKEYNANMDDVLEFGPTYRFNKSMKLGSKLQFAINKPDIRKSAILVNFGLSI